MHFALQHLDDIPQSYSSFIPPPFTSKTGQPIPPPPALTRQNALDYHQYPTQSMIVEDSYNSQHTNGRSFYEPPQNSTPYKSNSQLIAKHAYIPQQQSQYQQPRYEAPPPPQQYPPQQRQQQSQSQFQYQQSPAQQQRPLIQPSFQGPDPREYEMQEQNYEEPALNQDDLMAEINNLWKPASAPKASKRKPSDVHKKH